jgi:hypothetical protein
MKQRNGSTLAEVLVGAIIMAMAAAVVGGILLSTYKLKSCDKVRYSLAAAEADLREDLKNYVTADTSIITNAPGDPPWHMPEDVSCDDCWALAPGVHDVSGRLSRAIGAEYNATLTYTVTQRQWQGRTVTNVKITTNWQQPGS